MNKFVSCIIKSITICNIIATIPIVYIGFLFVSKINIKTVKTISAIGTIIICVIIWYGKRVLNDIRWVV